MRYRMRYPYDAISFLSHTISHCDIVCDIPMMRYLLYCIAISHCDILLDIVMQYRMWYPYDEISHGISHCNIPCEVLWLDLCDVACDKSLNCAIICFPVAWPARWLGDFCFKQRRALCKEGFVQTLYFTTGLHQRRRITHREWATHCLLLLSTRPMLRARPGRPPSLPVRPLQDLWILERTWFVDLGAVSYTHLTLPTKRIV